MSANNPSNGRYAAKVLSSTGEKLYLSENFADFHFIFKSKSDDGSSERIPVHRNILATASDVFRVMFNGSWKEKVDVEIVDASVDAFKEFLQFFYHSEVTVTSENVAEVMNLGKKYDVSECFNVCGQFLMENLSDDNIFEIYELALHLEHEKLTQQCVQYIELNVKTIFTSENFLKCDRKMMKRILQFDRLFYSEVGVFKALVNWMKAKTEPAELTQQIVQDQFSDLLQEIRFGSMILDEFLSLDPMYGDLLTNGEHREIVQTIHSERFEPKLFKAIRRTNFESIRWNEDAVIKCDRLLTEEGRFGDWSYFYSIHSNTPYFIQNIEKTTFTVNKALVLEMFHWLSPITEHEPKYLQCKIKFIEIRDPTNSNEKVVHFEGKCDLRKDSGFVFPKPIFVQPGMKYEIQLEINPTSTIKLCTHVMFKHEVQIDPDIVVQFQNDPTIDNKPRGLICRLDFIRI